MANHAYVVAKKVPRSLTALLDVIQEELLNPIFRDTVEAIICEDVILVIPKGAHQDSELRIMLWVGEYQDADYGIKVGTRCIEFRHGHQTSLAWWMSNVLCRLLTCRYDGQYIDDGVGLMDLQEKIRFSPYEVNSWITKTLKKKLDKSMLKDYPILHVFFRK